MTGNTMHARRALLWAAVLACSTLAACGGGDRKARRTSSGVGPTAPTPAPTPPPQYTATPVPFNLTQSRTFDTLGWESWPDAPAPSGVRLRWNAAIGKYEVLAPGHADWSRLEARQDVQGGDTPYEYDVFDSGGTKLAISMILFAPPHRVPAEEYIGNARIFESFSADATFAFGIATTPGDVPARGMLTCSFGEDEIGGGELTVDAAAGTVSGWVEPFWSQTRHLLVQTNFAAGATTFSATFGTNGVMDGRFFGPRAVNVGVRTKGGGPGFTAVNGIMTGVCKG